MILRLRTWADKDGDRSLVYVQGEARMNTYEDADGKRQTSLSIVQRECSCTAIAGLAVY